MEEIVVFPFEIRDYVCDVRTKKHGPPKFRKLEDLLALPRSISSYGTPDGRVIDTGVRDSSFLESVFEFDIQKELVLRNLRELVPASKENYIDWQTKQKYQVLVYETGGFFKAHSDTILNKSHYGTLLIFPPAIGECSHVGGDLLITKQNGQQFVFESAKNLQWTIVAFHPRLVHEILPITSGKRVVLKTELCYLRSAIQTPEEELNWNNYRPEMVD